MSNVRRIKTTDLELKDRLVAINRVTKVTKGGRTFTFSAIVVVGNEDGVVGYGLGKANEVNQLSVFGGAKVYISPASHGTGVKAGGAMRAVLESVGVKDCLAKSKGSSNPHNVVKATIEALSQMRDAKEVAFERGISMEKVFKG